MPDTRTSPSLSLEQFRIIAGKLAAVKGAELKMVFHGGEPTLMGVDYFQAANRILFEVLGDERENLGCGMQTNATLLDESWVPVIKEMFGGKIGISFDADIRKIEGSHAKFRRKWLENVRMLQDNGIFCMVLMTVTSPLIDKGIDSLFGLFDQLSVRSYRIQRYVPGSFRNGPDRLEVSDDEFYGFLGDVLERYFELRKGGLISYDLDPATPLSRSMVTFLGQGVWSGNCMSQNIVINPDGSVGQCPHLAACDEVSGNILTDPIEDLLYSPARLEGICKQKRICEACGDCEHISVCNGGCLLVFARNDGVACREFFSRMKSLSSILNKREAGPYVETGRAEKIHGI